MIKDDGKNCDFYVQQNFKYDRKAVKLLDGCKMSIMAIFKTTYEETYCLKIIMLTFRVFGEKLGAVLPAFSFFEENVFNFFSNNSENTFTHFSLW